MSKSQQESASVEAAIGKLKQGLLTGSRKLTAIAFRKLHGAGAEAVAPLRRELQRIGLEDTGRPEISALLGGFATILHDISEDASLEFIDGALSGQCHPVYEALLRTIRRFRRSDFREVDIDGIGVFEARTIDERYCATEHLTRWLKNVPEEDLDGISRIYIIEKQLKQEFAGYYVPYISVITVVWPTALPPKFPLHWLFRLGCESTIYHEVGHHRHGHTEYGQVPEQERQANRYAAKLLLHVHPWLTRLGLGLVWLLGGRRTRH